MSNVLFNSFDAIYKSIKPISEILPDHKRYKAHRPSNGSSDDKETLEEHIVLVNDYAFLLIKKHGLEPLIDNMINELVKDFKNDILVGNWVKKLFLSAIVYHDYGKINPNFQSEKMKETSFQYDKSIKIDTQHSKLSAYIYVNDYVQKLNTEGGLSEEEKYFLNLVCSAFSIPILRHHAPYIDSYICFKDDELKSINRFLKDFDIPKSYDDMFSKEALTVLLEDIADWKVVKNPILLVILMKLNFSLLTSSDYYATSEYMNGFPIDDFGLIDGSFKAKLHKDYWNFDYNANTKDNWNLLKSKHFDELQERNNKNLNTLRAKLLIETVEAIKQNPNKNLYYLEAPTGSGKTNLSLALGLELLKNEDSLNKIFYVFPFTTLIVQTFDAIKKTLDITNEDIIQLHSKSGFHSKAESNNDEDAKYGNEKLNYLDNLFLNFPITLLTHIKFFNILKGNDKETNYIFHRLANSVVIIDELQSYNPKHWDKMAWMLSEYGRIFNIKFLLMSATLPKINEADKTITVPFERLIQNKNNYFQNPNFGQRVEFDFSLLDWEKPTDTEGVQKYLDNLACFIKEKSDVYAQNRENKNKKKVRTIVEFIKKKSANEFYQKAVKVFKDYKIYLLSGEILDPRRRHIIESIKAQKDEKVLLITTQVVEAGVDIDMDLGFKDRSLIDSDEQLAGRVNRNADKKDCKVYIFDYDNEMQIYRSDDRRKVTKEKISRSQYEDILKTKDFDKLYQLVFDKIIRKNNNDYIKENVKNYKNDFERLDFKAIKNDFKLIEDETTSVFVPLPIPSKDLDNEILEVAKLFNISTDGFVDGAEVFEKYVSIITNKDQDFHRKAIDSKKMYGLLSKFMFSVYENAAKELMCYSDKGSDKNYTERFDIVYLLNWKDYKGDEAYSYESGINQDFIKNDIFL